MPVQPRRPTKERVLRVLQDAREMRQSSSLTTINVNGRFKEQPPRHTKRVTFSKPTQPPIKENEMQCGLGLTSCLITSSTTEQRQYGGANDPNERKVNNLARTDSECRYKAPGIDFLTFHDTTVTTHEVQMSPSVPVLKNMRTTCEFFPKYVDERPFKDQTTQTLYRESSAQTLAYLPDLLDKDLVDDLEIFNLPTILPGANPPGLYEVEVLERARKRWEFNKALKTNFRRKMKEARKEALNSKYRTILEAFEWEHWIEREEYIQECQMMRLEIVIRMFDKREKEMHEVSKTRIEMACERIEKQRQRGLHKNELSYQRGIRRLETKLSKNSRKTFKSSPTYALGSPCSEFYGPLIRHGVDPARRHYVGIGQKTFDMRIDDLEKRVDMTKLQCPFTKLREWSKPKEYVKEYEQNFCSDNNLQKLYESLKGLRTQATKLKMTPKCLKHRPRPLPERESIVRLTYEYESQLIEPVNHSESQTDRKERPSIDKINYMKRYENQKQYIDPKLASKLLSERRQEALENVLNQYEGSFIGWIMQFLSEEMERLKEQRKLHFFSILAQKERWRREAAEAGLRQKENDMRILYEEMFQQTNQVHNEVTKEYIDSILTTDMSHVADREATESITALAKQIDIDIKRWLDSFKSIQNPLNFVPLREMLRDMVFPDINVMLKRYENSQIAQYIIDDVLMAKVWHELEPYDIVTTLLSDLIDRLIDNDLYLFSTDSENEDGRPAKDSWKEARAIIRKLIRQAVPGQRWKDENERVCHEIYNDLLDDIFLDIFLRHRNPSVVKSSDLLMICSIASQSVIKESDDLRDTQKLQTHKSESSHTDTELVRVQILTLLKKLKKDKITKMLESVDHYEGDDQHDDTNDVHLRTEIYKPVDLMSLGDYTEADMFSVISALDISKEQNLKDLKHMPEEEDFSSTLSDIGVNFGPRTPKTPRTPKPGTPKLTGSNDLLMNILKDVVGSDNEDEDEDEEEDDYIPESSEYEYEYSSESYIDDVALASEDDDQEMPPTVAGNKEISGETTRTEHLSDLDFSLEAELTSRLVLKKQESTPGIDLKSNKLTIDNDANKKSQMKTQIAESDQEKLEDSLKATFKESEDNEKDEEPSKAESHSNAKSLSLLDRSSVDPTTLPHVSLSHFSQKLSGTASQKTSEYEAMVLETLEEEGPIVRKVYSQSNTAKKITTKSHRE